MQVKAKELYDTMGTIAGELNTEVVAVKTLRDDPDSWSIVLPQLEELKTDLHKAASIHLSQVTTDAHNIYKSMLDLTGVTIQTLQMGMKAGASDATKASAVKGAMTLFAASAQSSAQQLEALKEKVRTIAKAQELYATMLTIATELNNAAIFVKTMPDPDFWSMTLRELEKLKTDLQKAYDAGQPSAAAPPSPSPAPQ